MALIITLPRYICSSKKPSISPVMKLQQIDELSKIHKSNIITLDDSTYEYYAITKPRPYSLIVFLTATHPKFKCSVCRAFDTEFQILSKSYLAVSKKSDASFPLYFIRLDYDSSERIFKNYDVNIVPIVYHIGPFLGDLGVGEFEVSARDKYVLQSSPEAETIARFVRDCTGIDIPIKRSKLWTYVAILGIFIVLSLLVKPVILSLPYWLELIQCRSIWGAVSALVYTCAISGLIFDIIRLPPMYYADPQTGQIMFFYDDSGSQFVIEGFIVGFLNLVCAGSLIFLTALAPQIRSPQVRSTAITVACVCFIGCFLWIRSLYCMKSKWYMAS